MLRSRVVGNRVSTSVEPRTWFAATGFGGGQQAHDGDGTLAGSCRAGEQPVFAPQCDWPDRVLDRVVVDRVRAVAGLARQRLPAMQGVVDRVGGATVAQDLRAQVV